MGQQEIHEHEALGGRLQRLFDCLTAEFLACLWIILRIILDSTSVCSADDLQLFMNGDYLVVTEENPSMLIPEG